MPTSVYLDKPNEFLAPVDWPTDIAVGDVVEHSGRDWIVTGRRWKADGSSVGGDPGPILIIRVSGDLDLGATWGPVAAQHGRKLLYEVVKFLRAMNGRLSA